MFQLLVKGLVKQILRQIYCCLTFNLSVRVANLLVQLKIHVQQGLFIYFFSPHDVISCNPKMLCLFLPSGMSSRICETVRPG